MDSQDKSLMRVFTEELVWGFKRKFSEMFQEETLGYPFWSWMALFLVLASLSRNIFCSFLGLLVISVHLGAEVCKSARNLWTVYRENSIAGAYPGMWRDVAEGYFLFFLFLLGAALISLGVLLRFGWRGFGF